MGRTTEEGGASPLRARLASLASFSSSETDRLMDSKGELSDLLSAISANRGLKADEPPPYSQAMKATSDETADAEISKIFASHRITNAEAALASKRIADGLAAAEQKLCNHKPLGYENDLKAPPSQLSPVMRQPQMPLPRSQTPLPESERKRPIKETPSENTTVQKYFAATLIRQGHNQIILWKRNLATWALYRWQLETHARRTYKSTTGMRQEIQQLQDTLHDTEDTHKAQKVSTPWPAYLVQCKTYSS